MFLKSHYTMTASISNVNDLVITTGLQIIIDIISMTLLLYTDHLRAAIADPKTKFNK